MKWASTAGLIALAALSQAWAADAPDDSKPVELSKEEVSIPFMNLRSTIRTWQADGQSGVWIQDLRKQWYYAKTYGYCDGLDFANELGFKTGTVNTLDRFSQIIVPGRDRCPIKSLTKSEPPPSGKRHKDVKEDVSKDAGEEK
jgi:hypothetical protein